MCSSEIFSSLTNLFIEFKEGRSCKRLSWKSPKRLRSVVIPYYVHSGVFIDQTSRGLKSPHSQPISRPQWSAEAFDQWIYCSISIQAHAWLLFSAWHKPGHILEEGISTEEFPPTEKRTRDPFLSWWLNVEGPSPVLVVFPLEGPKMYNN